MGTVNGLALEMAALERVIARLQLVGEVGTVLGSTLDVDEALRRLARLVVPRLADWVVVDLLDDDGAQELRRAVVVHRDPERAPEGAHERPLPPVPDGSASSLAQVLRGGAPVLLGADELAAVPDSPLMAAQHGLFDELGAGSAVVAALRTPRRVLGALTLVRRDPAPPYDAEDVELAADLAQRAGLAVDNAQLFDAQRRVAETMQRHLLPALPDVDHIQLAARYRPAHAVAHVGGDWYDSFLLPDGVTTMVVGDVVGHDLPAAARMAQLRNMLRALAWDRTEPPHAIVRRLDQAATHVSDARMATLVFARIEGPVGGPHQLRWTSAGHPPPLLVTEDGQATYLEGGEGMILGVQPDAVRHDALHPLPARATVLLYTDGLVENRREPIDAGLTRLRQHASALARHDLGEFCDQLVERLAPDGTDDVALLALRLPAEPFAEPDPDVTP
ncbi:PP2C family protein-serine/threonine phosphatase [Pseudonocardia kunmingensis]|uniref:protein-serine/threonine phosphatase n=1 Tax=Pseudonocardia kunmingensis TaxID=630975 RepID=A0A543DVY3_9PSEU|nr:GAF domain-containing SpoIIE family protein phosphatase [Pseudonocardia kunmingensis]TQM13500.1 serine phosphatase RsbU (regulator of sigma subunit) [Pseudonocardia kunmingensis]